MTDNEIAKSIYLAANQGIPVIKLEPLPILKWYLWLKSMPGIKVLFV